MNYTGPPLPTGPTPPKRHRIRAAFGIIGALVLAVIFTSIIASALAGTPKGTRSQTPATPVYTPAAPVASTAPADVTPPPAQAYVVFTVTGSAPSGATIMYGSNADNITPPGSLGVLGNGVALPFTATLKFDPAAMYYDINAQLEGSGSITAMITVKRAGYADLMVSHGSASGGYNIASAQAAPASTDGSSWTPEG